MDSNDDDRKLKMELASGREMETETEEILKAQTTQRTDASAQKFDLSQMRVKFKNPSLNASSQKKRKSETITRERLVLLDIFHDINYL